MPEQKLSELETKILNCVHYSPHSMSVKPNQVIELIAYILASQAQPTSSQSVDERAEREKERADAWANAARELCKEELGIDDEDSGGSVKDWNAIVCAVKASKNKPQPTSQDVIDAELYRTLKKLLGYQLSGYDGIGNFAVSKKTSVKEEVFLYGEKLDSALAAAMKEG